jgi:hypothetical protein
MLGRREDALALLRRLLALRMSSDSSSEEYDHVQRRLIGNFPQASTHLALIASAGALAEAPKSAKIGQLRSMSPDCTVSPPSGEQHEIRRGSQRAIATFASSLRA